MTNTRRNFIKHTSTAAIASSAFLNLNPKAIGANEKLNVALFGAKGRGDQLANEAIGQGVHIHTLCDIDDAVLDQRSDEYSKKQDGKPKTIKDYRAALDDSEIDAVIIALPDHWHAIPTIEACQAGKDVYIEKPLSHTINEGIAMRDAARKYDRIVQIGTQRRSQPHFASAVEYVAAGKLGKICMMKAWMCQVRGDIGNPPDETVPEGVDYDRWLGPAPERAFNPMRFHYNWRFFWDYCNSELGNQGVHLMDIAMWAVAKMKGLDNALPTKVSGNSSIYWLEDMKEVPDTQVVTYHYDDFMLAWELRSFQSHHPLEGTQAGTGFYGSKGTLIVDGRGWKVYNLDGKVEAEEKAASGSHINTFAEAVKSRKRPIADVEVGRISTTMCHLGNINGWLGRDLHFDGKTNTFGDDQEANTFLSKNYREPYSLPAV